MRCAASLQRLRSRDEPLCATREFALGDFGSHTGLRMRLTPRSLSALHNKINAANAEALARMGKADIVLEDLRPARELIPALADPKRKLVLISGPPVTWKNMGNAQKGAVAGICIFEVSRHRS